MYIYIDLHIYTDIHEIPGYFCWGFSQLSTLDNLMAENPLAGLPVGGETLPPSLPGNRGMCCGQVRNQMSWYVWATKTMGKW